MFRLSFKASKSQEPELDFRPSAGGAKSKPVEETSSFEKLAEAERIRWSQGGGGAVVGDVEWVPDPITGGQRALFRPVSSKILESVTAKSDSAEEEENMMASQSVEAQPKMSPQTTNVDSLIPASHTPSSNTPSSKAAASSSSSSQPKPAPTGTARRGRSKKPTEDPMANMTSQEKSAYAKNVIEAAIEAERIALEQKLATKKKG